MLIDIEAEPGADRDIWSAQPTSKPTVATVPGPNGGLKVLASWHGSTTFARWRVAGAARSTDGSILASSSVVPTS